MNEYELLKASLWRDVFVAVCRSDNCTQKETASRWADYSVEEFESKFKHKLLEKNHE